MDQEVLVDSKLTDSIELVKKLDAAGCSPSFALWYYFTDVDEWRFVIAGRPFDQLLRKDNGEALAYRAVIDALKGKELAALPLTHVRILNTSDALLAVLQKIMRTGPTSIIRAWFTDSMINGVFVKNMVLLRNHVD